MRFPRLLVVLTPLLATPAHADLVSPYGGETAPNFAELAVLPDHVHVTLEIDTSDYRAFVVPDDGSGKGLAARTGRTFAVSADGVPLAPVGRVVDVRQRRSRPTSALQLPVPPRPRSLRVVYVELDFPFSDQPRAITFTPPLDASGMSRASIGMLAEHVGVPVTDYRYLSQAETIRLDWGDPWFTAFENPNLTRHHKSPLMSFVTVEPREVRHEVILRVRDLERWVELGPAGDTLDAAGMAAVKDKAAAFLGGRNPVVIDGRAVRPAHVAVSQITVSAAGLTVLEDAPSTDRNAALLGVVMSYPVPALPAEVTMTWELFPESLSKIPVSVTDPAGGVPGAVTAGEPTATWTNYLRDWHEPAATPVPVERRPGIALPIAAGGLLLVGGVAGGAALRAGRSRRRPLAGLAAAAVAAGVAAVPVAAAVGLSGRAVPGEEAARALTGAMADNIAAALVETQDAGFAAALTPFVAPAEAVEVGGEIRRGFSVTLPSGARARTEAIADVAVETIEPRTGARGGRILGHWTATVSGGHWGHLHRREIRYRALMDVAPSDGVWLLDGLTVLSAEVQR